MSLFIEGVEETMRKGFGHTWNWRQDRKEKFMER